MESGPTILSLIDAAVGRLREITAGETDPHVSLRVDVYSGGCSGFRYWMMVEDAPTGDDHVLEASGIRVCGCGSSFRTADSASSPGACHD